MTGLMMTFYDTRFLHTYILCKCILYSIYYIPKSPEKQLPENVARALYNN